MQILKVSWIDAQHPAGEWVSRDSLKGRLPVIQSAGFLVHEDKRKIVLAAAVDDGGHISAEITIPKSAVVKRRVLR